MIDRTSPRRYRPGVRSARALPALALALCCAAAPTASAADPVAGLEVPVTIKAREQPVGQFVRELFGQMGVPVQVDEGVRGAVNGDFDKSAGEVLEDLRRAFQLTYYYDGAVLHVYPAGSLTRDIMYLPDPVAREVASNARALELTDDENRVELAEMGLVATGTERFLEQVRELSDEVEGRAASAVAPETFRVFKLDYGWADDVTLVLGGQEVVVPGVASLLARLVGAEGMGAPIEGVSGASRRPLERTRPSLKGEGLQSVGAAEAAPGQALDALPPEAVTTLRDGPGRARIVADPLNNAVVIRDRADRMESYERLIATLDVEPRMVEIQATIIDMNTDRLRELGVDWRLGGEGSDAEALIGSSGGVTPIGDGGIVSLVLGDRTRFISQIRALESQGAARVVSRPHVITLANVEAVLDSTSTFFVRVEGEEEVDLFDVSVGTTLRVTPHVLDSSRGGGVKLLVGIEDGTASDQRVDRIPVIERSTSNTQALVERDQSLLIGGLIREAEQNGVSKVPVLGDIPGLGALFRSTSKSARQTERLFLITPRLVGPVSGNGPLRLDAPILVGDDRDIVSSAPLRLESARAALAERDETFSTVPELPGGSANATLGAIAAGGAPRRVIRLERGSRSGAGEGGATPAGRPWPEAIVSEADTVPGFVPTAEAAAAPRALVERSAMTDGDDGWEEVPGSRPFAVR